jgi:hypothetical protein
MSTLYLIALLAAAGVALLAFFGVTAALAATFEKLRKR